MKADPDLSVAQEANQTGAKFTLEVNDQIKLFGSQLLYQSVSSGKVFILTLKIDDLIQVRITGQQISVRCIG